MDNRRETYRVHLSPRERIPAEIQIPGASSLAVQIVSLSLGGAGIVATDAGFPLPMHQRLQFRFCLPPSDLPIELPAQIRRAEKGSTGRVYGLEFLVSGDEKEDAEREKLIWPFLLERQNREIRGLRHPPKQK